MKIKIDEIGNRIQIELDPRKYFLVKAKDDFMGEYALAPRIDMSYCGKQDQVSGELIYLTEEEYKKIKGLVDEIIQYIIIYPRGDNQY